MNDKLRYPLGWLISFSIPFVLILAGVRLLITPALLPVEYAMPGFPEDTYGFTLQDRLHWGTYAINYLLNDADTTYLSDLRFEDGSPVFNAREVSHMLDVKLVVQGAMRVLMLLLAGLAGLGVWAWRSGWWNDFRRSVARGGWWACWGVIATAALAGAVFLLGGAQGFYIFFWNAFAGFHALFFEGDSWLFLYSDTLIRLFPIRFWQDMFLYVFAFTALGGAALGWLVKPK